MSYGAMVIGGAINAGQTILSNVYGRHREEEARAENYGYNELSAYNADRRTRNLYYDLQSPQALLEQYKAAGLSPSLMFGGQGAGAQPAQGAQGAGASGLAPNVYGFNALEGAQIALLNAQTRKTNAEAANEEGVGPIGDAKVKEFLTQAGLNKALTAYNNAAEVGKRLDNYIKENTKEFEINKARALADRAATEAMKAVYETISAQTQAEFDEKSLEERLKQVTLVNQDLTMSALLKKSNIKLNDAEIKRIDAECEKWRQELLQGWCKVIIDFKNANTQEEFMKNIDKYWDDSIENLNNRLDFDKSKFDREMRYKWTMGITTFVSSQLNLFGENLMKLLPTLGKGPVKVSGLQ